MTQTEKTCEACRSTEHWSTTTKLNYRNAAIWFLGWFRFSLIVSLLFVATIFVSLSGDNSREGLEWGMLGDALAIGFSVSLWALFIAAVSTLLYHLRTVQIRRAGKTLYYYIDTEGAYHRHGISPIDGVWQILLRLPTNGFRGELPFNLPSSRLFTWGFCHDNRGWWRVEQIQKGVSGVSVLFKVIEKAMRFALAHDGKSPDTVVTAAAVSQERAEYLHKMRTERDYLSAQLLKIMHLVDESSKRGRPPALAREINNMLGRTSANETPTRIVGTPA